MDYTFGAGIEENRDICLVVVMEDGWDKEKLQINDMPFAMECSPRLQIGS